MTVTEQRDEDFEQVVEQESKRIAASYKGYSKTLEGFRNALESPAITAEQVYEKILLKEQQGIKPIPSGLRWWDSFCGPFRRGNTYVIAGYPGVGKTTLAINLAISIARQGYKTWFYCLELSSEEVFEVAAGHLTKKSPVEGADRTLAYSELQSLDFRFYEPTGYKRWDKRLDEICHTVENEKIQFVFIDNLMYLTRSTKDTFEIEGYVSQRIKGLSQQLDIPIVILHHLRKPDSDSIEPEPNLYSMRGSGAIGADASDVFIQHHPIVATEEELRHPVGYITSGKPRWGRGGKWFIRYAGEERTFYPATKQEYPAKQRRKRKYDEDPF